MEIESHEEVAGGTGCEQEMIERRWSHLHRLNTRRMSRGNIFKFSVQAIVGFVAHEGPPYACGTLKTFFEAAREIDEKERRFNVRRGHPLRF